MEIFNFPMETQSVFETPEHIVFENDTNDDNWMDLDLIQDTSSSLSLFQELEQIQEVKDEIQDSELLAELISECGIPIVEEPTTSCIIGDETSYTIELKTSSTLEQQTSSFFPLSPASSTSSDIEVHQSLIDELEDFFGSPTTVPEDDSSRGLDLITKTSVIAKPTPSSILQALSTGQVFNNGDTIHLTEENLKDAHTTSCITEDGQNVIIIIAPPSPPTSNYDTDPEWVPSPSSEALRTLQPSSTTIKKKYQRSKPPTPPSGPYPVEKRERKKAQNRTAAFRYREKKKGELDVVELEMEQLKTKNIGLREKLSEMETEAKLLKKLMIEAGLGKYAAAVKL